MAKSVYVQRLDEVLVELAALLQPLGFRKKGRTFNRSIEEGVVQVVHLWNGPFPIGAPLPKPAANLRPNLYGKFAIDLGVHVREVWQSSNPDRKYLTFIQSIHCQIRKRFGSVGNRDCWWPLDDAPAAIIDNIAPLLLTEGLDLLERFERRELILHDWIAFNDCPGRLSNVARIDVALIYFYQGNKLEAIRLLNEQITLPDRNKGHVRYVRDLALRLGLGELKGGQ